MAIGTIRLLLLTSAVGDQISRGLLPEEAFWNGIIARIAEDGISMAVNLVLSILVLVLGKYAIGLLCKGVSKAMARMGVKTLIQSFVRNAVSKCCWVLLIGMVLSRLGVHIGPLLAGLGVTGFVLGFAFQESLGNFAAGIMIAINEPYKIGDYVTVAGYEGFVRKMDLLATTLTTRDNKKVIIPNKSAWGSPIVNYTTLGFRRIDLLVGIDYGCDVPRALKVALETLPTVPGVLTEPAPDVGVDSMDDSQITLCLRPWANCEDFWRVRSDVQMAIKAAFDRNKIEIPFPQITVHTAS